MTLSSTVTGGTGLFSWQWYDDNGQILGKSGTGLNASYLVSAADTGIYVIFTDTGTGSATPTATATSSPPVAVTVNGVPSVSIAPIGPVTLAVGQPQTFTATPTGGSGSYSSYHWYKGAWLFQAKLVQAILLILRQLIWFRSMQLLPIVLV